MASASWIIPSRLPARCGHGRSCCGHFTKEYKMMAWPLQRSAGNYIKLGKQNKPKLDNNLDIVLVVSIICLKALTLVLNYSIVSPKFGMQRTK